MTATISQAPFGQWHGVLAPHGAPLRLEFVIFSASADEIAGTFASIDQSSQTLPLSEIRLSAAELAFQVPAIKAQFIGKWDGSQRAWDGVWNQGISLPLVLKEGPSRPLLRTQESTDPTPYHAEDVHFSSPDGTRLAGTLTIPDGPPPFPAAILLSGSGAQNRDEEFANHKPFRVLADHLSRQGIAALRFDDRGVGKSSGDFATATMDEFVADADAAFEFLAGRTEIKPDAIGTIGHSEGGLVGGALASVRAEMAFLILLASPAETGAEIVKAQNSLLANHQGANKDEIADLLAKQEEIHAIIVTEEDQDAREDALRQKLHDPEMPESVLKAQVRQLATPWYRRFLTYDPRPCLRDLSIPLLALNGSLDWQVDAVRNLDIVRNETRHNVDVEIVEMTGLNHLFQEAETGDPAEYPIIAQTIAPQLLTLITDWISLRFANS